jgi:hypothetical protein
MYHLTNFKITFCLLAAEKPSTRKRSEELHRRVWQKPPTPGGREGQDGGLVCDELQHSRGEGDAGGQAEGAGCPGGRVRGVRGHDLPTLPGMGLPNQTIAHIYFYLFNNSQSGSC